MKPDFFAELTAYVPADAREAEEKAVILDYALRFQDTVLTRENRVAHITSSAFVVNAAGDKTLMAHHIQRGVWAWPGGHADGEANLLAVALREAEEHARRVSDAARREEEGARINMEQRTAEHARALFALRNPLASEAERAEASRAEADARANMEKARTRLKDSSDRRAAADQELRRLHDAARNTRPGPVQVELWRTRVEEARTALQHAVLIAPVRGKVFWVKAAQNGNVARGDELMKIMPLENLWVEARFTAGTPLKEGQRCTVELDEGPELEGTVQALSRAEGGVLAKIGLTLPKAGDDAEGVEAALYPGQDARVIVRVK